MYQGIARATDLTSYEAAAGKWAVRLNERYGIDHYIGRFESEHANYMGDVRRRIVVAWMGPMPDGPRWSFHLSSSIDGNEWDPTMASYETWQKDELRFKKLPFLRLDLQLDVEHVSGKLCLIPGAIAQNRELLKLLASKSYHSREAILELLDMDPSKEKLQAAVAACES